MFSARIQRNWYVEMGSLDVYYLAEHGAKPIVLASSEDVDSLIDQVSAGSPPGAPIMMDVHLSGDPYAQGLDVGVASDRGMVRYAGGDWPLGVISAGTGDAPDVEVAYFYMGNWRGFPARSEISLVTVSQAIKEFMVSNGARPTCVQWEPSP